MSLARIVTHCDYSSSPDQQADNCDAQGIARKINKCEHFPSLHDSSPACSLSSSQNYFCMPHNVPCHLSRPPELSKPSSKNNLTTNQYKTLDYTTYFMYTYTLRTRRPQDRRIGSPVSLQAKFSRTTRIHQKIPERRVKHVDFASVDPKENPLRTILDDFRNPKTINLSLS